MAAPTFVNGSSISAGLSANPGPPAGSRYRDLWVLVVWTNASNTFPTITDWTKVTEIDNANTSCAIYWRYCGVDPTASMTGSFTVAGGTALSSSNAMFARIYGFRGVDQTGTPFEDMTLTAAPTISSSPTIPGITTVGADRLAVAIIMVDDNSIFATAPPPATGDWSTASNLGSFVSSTSGADGMTHAIGMTVASATTLADASPFATLNAADYWHTLAFAVKPTSGVLTGDPPTVAAFGTITGVESGNVTPVLPTDWHVNDVAILSAWTHASNTFPAISGWTKFSEASNASISVAYYWRRLVAGDTDPSFTIASGTALSASNPLHARTLAVRGARWDSDPPVETVVTGAPTTGNTFDAPGGLYAQGDNRLAVAVTLTAAPLNSTWIDQPPPASGTYWTAAAGTTLKALNHDFAGPDASQVVLARSWNEDVVQGPAETIGNYSFTVTAVTTNFILSPNHPTTSLGDELALLWNVEVIPALAVGDTLEARWGIRAALGDTVQARWGIRTSLGEPLRLDWIAKAAITGTVQAAWGARVLVADTLAAQWGIRTPLADTIEARWGIRTPLGDTVEARWDVRQAVGDSSTLLWNVAVPVIVVGKELAFVWTAKQAVGDPLQVVWGVRRPVLDTLQALWNVRTVAGDPLQAVWDVRQAVGDPLQALWSTRQAVGDTLQALWDVLAPLGVANKALQVVWDARAAVADSLVAPWGVRASVGDAVVVLWDVESALAVSDSPAYLIFFL